MNDGLFNQPESAADDELIIGTVLAQRYEILEVLGKGGMGTVYRAQNRINGQIRAIKILHRRLISDPMSRQRFLAEATAAARMDHPNVVKIIDVASSDDGSPYLVMEYLTGTSLSSVLRREGTLPIRVALSIFSQVSAALATAHSQGIVHRDVKPSNVMIIDTAENRWFVKVVDFGIAKVYPEGDDATKLETNTGDILGSPPYMSPEQCLGHKIDLRSDIYSLGCLMYESLAGEPPLVGNNPISTMYKQINELPSPLTMKSAYGVNNIILKALQKDPAKRYQSALELSEELERVNVNSSSLSMFLSKFQLQIQQIKSIVINKLGSSKRPLVLVFVLTAMLISIGSTSILPLVFCKYPSGTELILKWRPLPSLLHFNQQMMLRNEDRRRELTRILETLSKSENIKPNPESIQLHRELGDIYFLNTNWVPAGHEYRAALSEGLTLFNKTYTNYGALPAFIHDICLSYLRYSQCQLVQRDYKEALTLATAGLRMSFSDADRDASYKAYFGQVMAVSSINLLSLVDSRSADYISKFSDYIESKRPTGIEAGRAALALSEVADCYIKLGAWERAIPILKKAKECWNRYESSEPSLQRNKNFVKFLPGAAEHFDIFALDYARKGKCGPYNSAVASELVAIAYEKIGNWQYADKYLLESSSEFESLLGLNDKSRCLVLFERANELWKRGSYFSSLAQKIEAQKIWVYRKNGTTEDKIPFNDKRFQWPPE